MMQAAKHRPFHNTEARWQLVSVATGRNALLAGFRQARTKTAGWPASVVGLGPEFPDRPQLDFIQFQTAATSVRQVLAAVQGFFSC